jgi:hypothetical protein
LVFFVILLELGAPRHFKQTGNNRERLMNTVGMGNKPHKMRTPSTTDSNQINPRSIAEGGILKMNIREESD